MDLDLDAMLEMEEAQAAEEQQAVQIAAAMQDVAVAAANDDVAVAAANIRWSQLVQEVPPATPSVDLWENAFNDMAVVIDDLVLLTCVDELVARWIAYQARHEQWALVAAYRLFNLDPDEHLCDFDEVESLAQKWKDICIRLYNRMVKSNLIMENEANDPNGKRIIKIMHLVSSSAAVIHANHRRFEHTMANYLEDQHGNGVQMWEARVGVHLAGDADAIGSLTTGQRLILHVLEQAFMQNLRKYQGFMYRQVLTPAAGGGMHRTHAWEKYCEYLPFVYKCVDKHKNWTMWCDLTQNRSNPGLVTEYLANANDVELRVLEPNRTIFSFTNGVYNARLDEMYLYDEGIPTSYVAAKFFDVPMPVDFREVEDWREIPTPALDGILDHQQLSTVEYVPPAFRNRDRVYDGYSVRDWVYVFMGRMIYDIGSHDTWQVLMFIKGKAGTGKSTIGKVLSNLYDSVDVGVLSNNTEKKFGLSALIQKLIYICYEVKKDFALDQGEMQSMISGEPMSIATKFQTASSVTWKSHGVFMGNEFPSWTNNSGSIGRRIVTVLFDHIVVDSNPKLFEELQLEMGNIIVKINRAYRQCAVMYGGEDIWKLLPPYFTEIREKELEAHTSVLSAFLVHLRYFSNGHDLVFDVAGTVSVAYFRSLFIDFVTENTSTNPRSLNWNHEYYNEPFARCGLRIEHDTIHGIRRPNMELH